MSRVRPPPKRRAAAAKPRRRSYDASGRRARAEETRARMVRTARELFAARGYAETSIETIAAQAGVAPQTFYAAFGSKRGVLTAMLDAADADAGVRAVLAELKELAGRPADQIAALVRFCARFYGRAADLIGIARAAGQTEPDLARLWQEGESRRRRGQEPVVRAWDRAGVLRLRPAGAALDVLWAMTGADWYRLLVADCGWPVERYEAWLTEALADLLLTSPRVRE